VTTTNQMRLEVLKAAPAFLTPQSDAAGPDALALAARWERWVNGAGEDGA
jgi:hypothetical protein